MSKRGENIYKRKDGRWEGRYVRAYDPSGKARLGYVYGKTYRETREKLWAAKAAHPGRSLDGDFSDYCDKWLALRRHDVGDSTYVKYSTIVRKHLRPALGKRFPEQIDTVLLTDFSRKLLEKGLAPKTAKDILMVLHALLQYISKQTEGSLPPVEVVYPRERRQEIRVLSPEEQARLVAFLLQDMDFVKFGVLLALLTGMRIGEVCALRWGGISLERGELQVAATMQRLQLPHAGGARKTQVVIGNAKSSASCRRIPLTDTALELCRRMQREDPRAFILTGRSDKYLEPRALQYRLKKYVQNCGLEGVHFHTLRHTFATRCVEVGFEIKSLSEILGHASTIITLDRYVHASMDLKRENMRKLSNIGM